MAPEHVPYSVGIGHDVADISMEIMVQQPEAAPVAPVERHYGVGGAHYDDGAYVCYQFGVIEDSNLYDDILAQFGLDSADYADVTVLARNNRLVITKYNGIARLPEPGADAKWQGFFWRDVKIYVTDLVQVIE